MMCSLTGHSLAIAIPTPGNLVYDDYESEIVIEATKKLSIRRG